MSKHKLQGKLKFRGISIAVENKKNTIRHWHDPNSQTEGMTLMKYPYGYIKGTLGLDGDEVDVFVGPDKKSKKVFVITQMRRDITKDGSNTFESIDEQKVMLGFSDEKEAKHAYMIHYDDYRFFGQIKQFTIKQFKQKLKHEGKKGKLIKYLYLKEETAMLKAMPFRSKAQQKFMYSAASRGEVPEKTVEEFSDKTKDFKKLPDKVEKACSHTKEGDGNMCTKCDPAAVMKALTSRMLLMANSGKSALANKVPLDKDPILYANENPRRNENPASPIEHIATPSQVHDSHMEVYKSCVSCGCMKKSTSDCIRCAYVRNQDKEATVIWKRK